MNPANHGQCHIRRNSRDERSEDLLRKEHHGQTAGVSEEGTKGTGEPLPHNGEERRPLFAEHSNASPTMLRAVMSQRAMHPKPRGRSGSWSGVNESDDGVWVLFMFACVGNHSLTLVMAWINFFFFFFFEGKRQQYRGNKNVLSF